jgi:hypothetical protein
MKGWTSRAIAMAVTFTVVIGIAGTAGAAALAGGTVNGMPGRPTAVPASASHCTLADDSGNPVTQVTIADRQGADTVYWVDFTVPDPTTPPTQATVSIKKPKATPGFWSETQKAIDLVGGAFYIVPFSIPQWGSNATVGSYSVKVMYNLHGGSASCTFTAVEPASS